MLHKVKATMPGGGGGNIEVTGGLVDAMKIMWGSEK